MNKLLFLCFILFSFSSFASREVQCKLTPSKKLGVEEQLTKPQMKLVFTSTRMHPYEVKKIIITDTLPETGIEYEIDSSPQGWNMSKGTKLQFDSENSSFYRSLVIFSAQAPLEIERKNKLIGTVVIQHGENSAGVLFSAYDLVCAGKF